MGERVYMNEIKDSGLRSLATMIIVSMIVLLVLLILDFLDSTGVIHFKMNSDWPSIVVAIMGTFSTLFFAVTIYKKDKNK